MTSTYKGLITGICMIAISAGIYYYKGSFQNNLQYITYAVYIAGITWSLVDFSRKAGSVRTFKNLFTEGFKCFIVITLLMVAFTWVFLKMNPSMKEEMAVQYRAELSVQGNYTPAETDNKVNMAKEFFLTGLIAAAIFGYLLIGSIITVIGSLFLKKDQTAKIKL